MSETPELITEPQKVKRARKPNWGGPRKRLTVAELRARNWMEVIRKRTKAFGAGSHG